MWPAGVNISSKASVRKKVHNANKIYLHESYIQGREVIKVTEVLARVIRLWNLKRPKTKKGSHIDCLNA